MQCFGAEIEHEDELVDIFSEGGHPEASVEKWLKKGKLDFMEDGYYYSHVSPEFRLFIVTRSF